jgi:hypothetical protein
LGRTDQTEEVLESYSRLLASRRYDERVAVLSGPFRDLVKAHVNGILDAQRLLEVYFLGFNAIASGRIEAESDLVQWVKAIEPSRNHALVARVISTNTIASLENYISTIYKAALGTYDSMRTIAKRYKEQTGTPLDVAIKPSAKASLRWPEPLLHVFNIDSDATTIETLKHLVDYRNKASHEDLLHAPEVSPKQIAMWILSAHAFVYQIALGVEGTLKRLEEEGSGFTAK